MRNMNDERVVLVNPAGWQKESVNLGLSYLASSLIRVGFSVLILDVNRYEMSDETLVERVLKFSPRLIGISVKTATACEGTRLADLLSKASPASTIVCGGPHMTLCPESYMQSAPSVSYGVMSEGERTIVEIALAVVSGTAVSGINGVVWRRGDEVIVNQWDPPADLDSLPFPNLDVVEGFSWEGFRYPIVTSRGCPFDCIYCCVNKLTGSRKWRFRSPESVVGELEAVAGAKGITQFEIWDDNFTLDLKRAKAICRLMIERGLQLSWYCHNGIRADRIDLELAQLMKQAGCTSIAFGIESGNAKTFDSIKKGEPLSAVVEAVRIVKSVGINAVGYFIIGLPGDTLERFMETVRFQRALNLHHYVFGMLIPYPNTEVWEIVKQHGVMFCEITQTQHFSDDIVPISFELPNFPKADMVRAFYIARYFDLLDATNAVRSRISPKVVYMTTPDSLASLAGMIIACGVGIRHVVVGADAEGLRNTPAFAQVPAETVVVFESKLRPGMIDGDTVVVCRNLSIPQELIFGNSGLVLIDPARPLHQVIQVRRAVQDIPLIPSFILSGVGVLWNLPHLLDTFGAQKMWEVAQIQLIRPLSKKFGLGRPPFGVGLQRASVGLKIHSFKIPDFCELLQKAKASVLEKLLGHYRLLSTTNRTRIMRTASVVTFVWQRKQFLRVKIILMAKRKSKGVYPYDEYSSYL